MAGKDHSKGRSSAARKGGLAFHAKPFWVAERAQRAKQDLIEAVIEAAKQRNLTQHDAAVLCGTTQSTFSSVVLGKAKHLTMDRLVRWVVAMGGTVEIRATPCDSKIKTWELFVAKAREAGEDFGRAGSDANGETRRTSGN
jgi:predicted XRE-type DNA-binding protein